MKIEYDRDWTSDVRSSMGRAVRFGGFDATADLMPAKRFETPRQRPLREVVFRREADPMRDAYRVPSI